MSPAHRPRQEERQPHEQQAADGKTLREGGEADAAVVDDADHERAGHADEHPARVHLPAGHGVEADSLEAGCQVAENGGQGDRLEGADRHVGEHQRPAADEGASRSKSDEREADLAAGARQGRRQLGVGEPHQPDHHGADPERQDRAHRTRPDDHLAGQHHPAPADHRAEGDGQHVAAAEQLPEVDRCVSHAGNPNAAPPDRPSARGCHGCGRACRRIRAARGAIRNRLACAIRAIYDSRVPRGACDRNRPPEAAPHR